LKNQIVVCCESKIKAGPYVRALVVLGIPEEQLTVLTPEDAGGEVQHLGAQVAGVVLCGGPDLAPERYGEEARDDANLSVMPELDEIDLDLIGGAEEGLTPVWAICRGMQVVNVFKGGTLWQDLPSDFDEALEHRPEGPHDAVVHAIEVISETDSISDHLTGDDVGVNSRHHQAVKDLGTDIRALAQSPDGVVEVLALRSENWWVKGVQWHPENLLHLDIQRRLWREFLEATKRDHSKTAVKPAAAPESET
jgi:putative glutamine amidotransferase